MLVASLNFVDRAEVWRHLHQMQVGWLALTLAILLAQFAVMATRWWIFARSLSVRLGYRQALAEYFLAGFLNQVLPFGILGDVGRAIRHAQSARTGENPGRSRAHVVLAIILDRASGQVALWLVVAAILPGWWVIISRQPGTSLTFKLPVGLLTLGLVAVAVVAWRRQRHAPEWRRLAYEGWRAMASPRNLAIHLPLSFVLVATHVLTFLTIAHGLAIQLSPALAFRVVPIVLVATTLPMFVAGWGVREATVAGLYHLAGLRGAEGVTIALVYGCLGLVASAPGVLALRRGS